MSPEDEAFLAAEYIGITDRTYGQGRVLITTQHLTPESSLWLNLRTWGTENTGLFGYRFRVSGGGTQMSISRMWEHDSEILLASKISLDLLFQPGEPIYVEASAVGERLSLKVWAKGATEPAEPQLVARDRYYSAGAIAIGVDLDAERERFVFVGDSPNDSPMFAHFPHSVGVANVRDFAGSLESDPAYVTTRAAGAGFAELADVLLAVR